MQEPSNTCSTTATKALHSWPLLLPGGLSKMTSEASTATGYSNICPVTNHFLLRDDLRCLLSGFPLSGGGGSRSLDSTNSYIRPSCSSLCVLSSPRSTNLCRAIMYSRISWRFAYDCSISSELDISSTKIRITWYLHRCLGPVVDVAALAIPACFGGGLDTSPRG